MAAVLSALNEAGLIAALERSRALPCMQPGAAVPEESDADDLSDEDESFEDAKEGE